MGGLAQVHTPCPILYFQRYLHFLHPKRMSQPSSPILAALTAPQILLFSVTLPTYVLLLAARLTGEGLSTLDLIFSSTITVLIALSATADQQQWSEYILP